jgi:hypothetical protein
VSGDSEPYSDDDIDELIDAINDAYADYDQRQGHHRGTPKTLIVTAQVEWSNTFQGPGGVRNVNLGQRGGKPVNLSKVRDALKQTGGPLKSYTAKGWQAQLRALGRVKRGESAKDAAGFRPSKETLRRWQQGTQKPSKANRGRIQRAYDRLRNPSGMTPDQAKANAVKELTDALGNAYSADIRFRDIRLFKFDD